MMKKIRTLHSSSVVRGRVYDALRRRNAAMTIGGVALNADVNFMNAEAALVDLERLGKITTQVNEERIRVWKVKKDEE